MVHKSYIQANNPEDWKSLLADPEKQWKTGYSAKTLAYCWQEANDFPRSVKRVFKDSGIKLFQDIQLLLAFPEYKVSLLGGLRASQNDIFILAKGNDELVSITVEGKVKESFGETVAEWKLKDRGGKKERLRFLCDLLQLEKGSIDHIRYQLLHRTVSAIIEAKKFNAPNALMLIHSFSRPREKNNENFQDYCYFLSLFGRQCKTNSLIYAKSIDGVNLYFGWVEGEKKYLEK